MKKKKVKCKCKAPPTLEERVDAIESVILHLGEFAHGSINRKWIEEHIPH